MISSSADLVRSDIMRLLPKATYSPLLVLGQMRSSIFFYYGLHHSGSCTAPAIQTQSWVTTYSRIFSERYRHMHSAPATVPVLFRSLQEFFFPPGESQSNLRWSRSVISL